MDESLISDPWIALAIVVACLFLSAFFSGAETAMTAASRARLHALETGGDRQARIVVKLLGARERLIGTMLIGNNVVNIGASAFTTSVLVAFFGDAGVIYATIVMSALVIVFAEILPKTVAINRPEQVALAASRPAAFFVALFGPVTLAIEAFVRAILRPFGLTSDKPVLSSVDELRGQVDLLHRDGGVVKDERDMLGGLLDMRELEVSDVMVHRTKMVSVDAELSRTELVAAVLAAPVTRLPLWRGSPENIVGVIHAKDLLRALHLAGGDAEKLDIEALAAEPWFVPDTNTVFDQLEAFLAKNAHIALVVDEYGEVMGLVTLEDILEEIVGDITDEHDVAVEGVRPQPDGSVNVDGGVPVRDLNRAMDWNLPDAGATTVAGLVIHEAQSIPEPGQAFTFYGFRFQVVRRNRNRLTLLRVTPLAARRKAAAR